MRDMKSRRLLARSCSVSSAPAAHSGPVRVRVERGLGQHLGHRHRHRKVVDTLRSGSGRAASRSSRDGTRLYISDQTANALVVVDTAKKTEVAHGRRSAIRPRASTCRPTASGCRRRSRRTTRCCSSTPATLTVAKRIRMHGKNPEHAVFSPDGRWLYASAEEADSVDIIDVGAAARW